MYPRRSADRERLDLLAKAIQHDEAKRNLLAALADGKWHSIHHLGRQLKSVNPNLGVVRIGIILADIQTQVGEELLEKNEGGEVAEWRVNPAYIEVVQSMLQR